MPEALSGISQRIDHLYYVILWVTGVAFVLVETALVIFLFLYRARQGRSAAYTHGNATVEVIWTIVPAAFLVFLAFASRNLWSEIHSQKELPGDAVTIKVLAERWQWNFTYPGPDNSFGTEDDFETIAELHMPVDRLVRFQIQSKDIIHSFFLPPFRLKQDAVPGLDIPLTVEANRSAQFQAACAEFCGDEHYQMKADVTVESYDDFLAWQKSKKAESW